MPLPIPKSRLTFSTRRPALASDRLLILRRYFSDAEIRAFIYPIADSISHLLALRELPAEVPAATAHPALDKALNSTLNAVPPVPRFPLQLGFAVDQRMSSFISLTTALETLIISFTFFKSSSYALVNIVTCEPNCCMFPCSLCSSSSLVGNTGQSLYCTGGAIDIIIFGF